MTDEAKALVERVETLPDTHALPSTLALLFDLRDYIETQAREIERLRGVLDRIYMEDRRIVERWRQSLATGDSHLDEHIVLGRYADIARAALAGDSHDQ